MSKSPSPKQAAVVLLALAGGVALLLAQVDTEKAGNNLLGIRGDDSTSASSHRESPGAVVVVDNRLTSFLETLPLGWENPPAPWLLDLCPEVVRHYTRFPSFSSGLNPADVHDVPLFPTEHAAQAVCTLKAARDLASSVDVGGHLYLHAGAHLGAILHGQPIPWDDDVDAFLDVNLTPKFVAACSARGGDGRRGLRVHPHVRLVCVQWPNAVKIWLQPDDVANSNLILVQDGAYYSPYIDMFSYKVLEGGSPVEEASSSSSTSTSTSTSGAQMQEVFPDGTHHITNFQPPIPVDDYFPTSPYYFGGIHVLGPRRSLPESRYDMNACYVGTYNHRAERDTSANDSNLHGVLDCTRMRDRGFPFLDAQSNAVVSNANNGQQRLELLPRSLESMEGHVREVASAALRSQWFKQSQQSASAAAARADDGAENADLGQTLTDALPNLNWVDVDNTISTAQRCLQFDSSDSNSDSRSRSRRTLNVVEYNAQRGRWWLEAAASLPLLRDADVIILNEMDVGMARSDQQHTARQMAVYLGMNYMWGVEFVELTRGNAHDRRVVPDGLTNARGLHGNAVLVKCGTIRDARIAARDPIGPYFSAEPRGLNAQGLERRLGGRMALLGRVDFFDTASGGGGATGTTRKGKKREEVVVGSIHKLSAAKYPDVVEYVGSSRAVIGGDQGPDFCLAVGLNTVGSKGNTWPASCDSVGTSRGDNICSDLPEAGAEAEVGAAAGAGADNAQERRTMAEAALQQSSTVEPCATDEFGIRVQVGDHALVSAVLEL